MKAANVKQHTKHIKKGLRDLAKEIRKLYRERQAEGGDKWKSK